MAALNGHAAVIRILLARGADVNRTSPRGTALGIAATYGFAEAVRALVAAGADVDARSPYDGSTPLESAVANGHDDVIRILVESSPGGRTPDGTALYRAAADGALELVRMLVGAGASVDSKTPPYDETPLVVAANNGHTEVVRFLILSGAEIDARTSYGGTALGQAVSNHFADIVRILVDAGADGNARDNTGGRAGACACGAPIPCGSCSRREPTSG